MRRTRDAAAFRLATASLFILITYFAVTPTPPFVEHLWDKANHFAAFYALALTTDFGFPNREFDWRKALTLLAYGLLIEVVQYFLPYRTADVLDLATDALALAAYWLSLPLLRHLPLLRSRWSAGT